MEISEKQQLLDSLLKGIVQVTFKKIDTGELRIMPCTLKPETLKEAGVTISIDYSATGMEAFPVWSLDKNAWRSFRLDTVQQWNTNEVSA